MDPNRQQLIQISNELNLDWSNDLIKLSEYLKLAWTDAEEVL